MAKKVNDLCGMFSPFSTSYVPILRSHLLVLFFLFHVLFKFKPEAEVSILANFVLLSRVLNKELVLLKETYDSFGLEILTWFPKISLPFLRRIVNAS